MPQSAFIYNASVRDNILFGLPFDQERYDQAIAAAAVRPDLDNMPGKIFIAWKKHHACMHTKTATCLLPAVCCAQRPPCSKQEICSGILHNPTHVYQTTPLIK